MNRPALRLTPIVAALLAVSPSAQDDWRTAAGLLPDSAGALAREPGGNVLRFGGGTLVITPPTAGIVASDETLLWDGDAWSAAAGLIVRPQARTTALLTYDSVRQRTVLHGGQDASGGAFVDTWEWDGAQWTQSVTATTPPARLGAMMFFDGTRVVMFGGTVNGVLTNETWSYDGVDWQLLSPQTSPPALQSSAAASGPGEGLLFGGAGDIALSGQTWRWDGTNWNQLSLAVRPSARIQAGMTYDWNQGRYVLYGGMGPVGLSDTWQFVAGQWSQVATQRGPSGIVHRTMSFHGATGNVVTLHAVGAPNPPNSGATTEFGADLAYMVGYGSRCSPTTPGPLRIQHASGQPRPGESFSIAIEPAVGIPLMALGWSDQVTAGGLALPFDLATIGGGQNCLLLQSADSVWTLPTIPEAVATLTIPPGPGVVGVEFYLQGFDFVGATLATMRTTRAFAIGVDVN